MSHMNTYKDHPRLDDAPLPIPLPQLRAHIQHLLDTHTEAPSLAAALREVFRVEEGWFIPEPQTEEMPAVMVFVLEGSAGPMRRLATLTRLTTTGVWSLLLWDTSIPLPLQSAPLHPRPLVGPERAAGLAVAVILAQLLRLLIAGRSPLPSPEVLAEQLCALGLPAEVTAGQGASSVLAEGWLLELSDGAWRGRRLGGAWVGPQDAFWVAMQWAQQLVQGEGKGGQGVRHG